MENEKTAIILAAGRGSRLKEMTKDQPKPMVAVQDKSIISKLVEDLIENGIDRIVVLVGYMAEKLQDHLKQYKDKIGLVFLESKIWETTNNIYTLWLAKDYLKEGFYLFEADIYCDQSIVYDLLHDKRENIILVDKFTSLMNGTVITDNEDSIVTGMYLKKDQGNNFDYSHTFKTVNFYKIGKEFVNSFFMENLKQHIENKDVNSYYELIVHEAIKQNFIFHSLKTGKRKWWEIDTQEDMEIARKIFSK